jgi:glucose repression mediator protein
MTNYINCEDLDFDKANEILFRLGIIYKQQGKYEDSLHCFDRILRNPPSPLAHADIWFQIGHVYEQQKDVRSYAFVPDLLLTSASF